MKNHHKQPVRGDLYDLRPIAAITQTVMQVELSQPIAKDQAIVPKKKERRTPGYTVCISKLTSLELLQPITKDQATVPRFLDAFEFNHLQKKIGQTDPWIYSVYFKIDVAIV